MIVNAHEGTALEVFWRHRGSASWSYLTALRFLLRLRLDRAGILSLRELLASRMSTGVSWRISEDEIVQRVATLIGQGRILVVENTQGKLWPDTGLVLKSRWQSFVLLCHDDLYPARDRAEATRWIRNLQEQLQKIDASQRPDAPASGAKEKAELEGYRIGLKNLRERLKTSTGADYSHLHDGIFIAEIERALQTGLLIPVFHAVSGHSEETAAAPAPPPVAGQQGGPDRDEPDPTTFDPAHSGASQAATLASAAEDGVPFCEVCEKGAA